MQQTDRQALFDIVNAAQYIQRFTQGITQPELEANTEKASAVFWQFVVLGEAVKRLSPDFREQYPDIPWKKIAGMRDMLTHQYDDIRLNIVWDAATSSVPELLERIVPLILEQQPGLQVGDAGVNLASLDRERVAFITEILPDLIDLENAARQHGDERLRGTFGVVVVEEDGLEGPLYEVTEGDRVLLAVTVRERRITGIPEFDLAPDEFESVRSRITTQKETNEVILQQLEARSAEDEPEP